MSKFNRKMTDICTLNSERFDLINEQQFRSFRFVFQLIIECFASILSDEGIRRQGIK